MRFVSCKFDVNPCIHGRDPRVQKTADGRTDRRTAFQLYIVDCSFRTVLAVSEVEYVAQKVMPVFDFMLHLLPLWWCLTKYPRMLMLWMGPPPWMISLVH